MKISEVTRHDIFDVLLVEEVGWSGRLEEPDFLNRIFDLRSMESYDGRFNSAYDDIWQHRVNNYDWKDDWLLDDQRFNLLKADDQVFLRFLCEMLHPVVRRDPAEVERLRQTFNQYLKVGGYEIVERTKISNKPVFAARLQMPSATKALESFKETFDRADAYYILQQITRMEAAIDEDPALAIGTAKELVETCCKTIMAEREIEIEGSPDLPQLIKQITKTLALTPDDIPENAKAAKTIRRLLSNLATITQGIAELRNHYGTGHGELAARKGLQPRHAKLAVGAASTLAIFLLETHQTRELKEPGLLQSKMPPLVGE